MKKYFILFLTIFLYLFSFILPSFSDNLILFAFWFGLFTFYLLWKEYPSYNYVNFIIYIFIFLFEFNLNETCLVLIMLCIFETVLNYICAYFSINKFAFSKFKYINLITIIFLIVSFFTKIPFYYVSLVFAFLYIFSVNVYDLLLQVSLITLKTHDILVLNANKYERLAHLNGLIFTKTGVLTLGEFEINEVEANDIKLFWEYLSLAQSKRNDRIARFIKNNKNYIDNSKFKVNNYQSFDNGISYKIGHKNILVGDKNFLLDKGIEVADYSEIGTIIYVYENKKIIGYIILNDKINTSTKKVISDLKKIVSNIIVFSKDQKRLTTNVARTLNISHSYGELNSKNVSFWLYYIKNQIGDNLAIISDDPAFYDINMKISISSTFENKSNSDIIIGNNRLNNCLLLFQESQKLSNVKKSIIYSNIMVSLLILFIGLLFVNKIWLLILLVLSIVLLQILYFINKITIRR